jgi:hypothetical protein
MMNWTYTSYESDLPVTVSRLSRRAAVGALERAIVGRDPFEDDHKPEPGTAEHRIGS